MTAMRQGLRSVTCDLFGQEEHKIEAVRNSREWDPTARYASILIHGDPFL
jgi:hypothetical protein